MNWGRIIEADCVDAPPPIDERCSDPAFALANPDLCPADSRLVIKPEIGMACPFESLQFGAFLVENGVETEVAAVFSSSDLNVAPVGALSGNATGLTAGVATITATFEGKTANAVFTIMDCDGGAGCESQHVAMMLVVDTSRSMSLAFGSGYAKRLDYAKAAATRFISEVNEQKDFVGLMSFNSVDFDVLSPLTADKTTVGGMVASIAQTQEKTAFYDALAAALAELSASGAERQVLVLLSDGESTAGTDTGSTSPFTLLSNFKAAGGIVICLGVRASGTGFATLSNFASGGFFINAYPAVAADSLDYLSGLKGYICAGNCTPEGDEIVSRGTLNYASFANWDVIGGYVDLQGNGFFDYLPDNGLYVDLISGMQPSGVPNGRLVSKVAISLVASRVYRLTVALAGNQTVSRTDPDKVRVRVYYLNTDGSATPVYLLDQLISIADYTQDFHDYAFSFTAAGAHDVYISIEQENLPTEGPMAGVLLNSVKFEDRTTLAILLDDDFDDENQEYIPPRCGIGSTYVYLPDLNGYGYATGYYCYGDGCLDTPPPTQVPDPSPLGNIESGTTPPQQTWTATKTECVSCEGGSTNLGENIIPILDGSTNDATASSEATNNAGTTDYAYLAFDDDIATKWTSEDDVPQWLQIDLGTAKTVDWYGITAYPSSKPTTWELQGSNDAATWTTLDQQNSSSALVPFQDCRFQIASPGAYRYYRLYVVHVSNATTLPDLSVVYRVALARLSLFTSSAEEACATETAESTESQADADKKASDAAEAAARALLNCPDVYTATEQYTARCPAGKLGQDVTRSATVTSAISMEDAVERATAQAKAAAEAELDCTLSNNTQEITIVDCDGATPAQSSPYPSVKAVTGLTGVVSKVTVSITKLSHGGPDDLLLLLRGPDGSTCMLMANCGGTNTVTDIDLIFDDTGAALPDSTAIASGTYAPTQYAPYADLPAPAPSSPYGTTLSVFNGINPNGSWSLWIADDTTLDSGTIESWDLTITTETGNVVYAVGDSARVGYQAIAEALAALVPDYDTLLYLGDVQGNATDATTGWTAFWEWGFGSFLDRIVYTPGNHDWTAEGADVKAATQDFWAGALSLIYGDEFPATVLVTDPVDFVYSYKLGAWKIISFNSVANADDANALNVGGSVYEAVEAELAEVGYNYILISHRPRWANDTSHGDNADLDDIWALACSKGVTAWLSGHSHIAMIGAPRDASGAVAAGPTQIINGTGGQTFYAFDGGYLAGAVLWDDNSEPLMCRLTLKPTSIVAVFLDTHGTIIAGSQVTISA